MHRLAHAILIISLLGAMPAAASDTDSDDDRFTTLAMLSETPRTAHDLKAVTYIENAHSQLDEWGNRLVARLERGIGPRQSDPLVDGRARFQVKKLRVTYNRYAHSGALKKAINALADAHAARLDALDAMLNTNVADTTRFAEATATVNQRIREIRNWSQGK